MVTTTIDDRLYKLADRYLPLFNEDGSVQPYESYFSHKLNNMGKDEFLIPVLGVQGTGKSSLLNAFLMDDLILPVDADETTCIPVEIRYGETKNGNMEVYFLDHTEPVAAREPKELEQYVHNAYNYGNEKNVSHIVVYKNSEILQNGVVFVDLPGVFSLTQQNMKTTMSYIEKLSAAIFLLRTVPPITRSEKVFLSTVWPKLTKAWFIQNQWNDESKREVQEGLEHNKKILQEIAVNHNTNEDLNIEIVNVYQALSGRLQDNDDMMQESGLENVVKLISETTAVWQKTLRKNFFDEVRLLQARLKNKLEGKLAEVQLDRRKLRRKFREQERIFDNMITDNNQQISRIKSRLQQFEYEIRKFAEKESWVQAENLRNEMRRITGSRVVDGELLTTAFQEVQRDLATDVLEELNLKLQEVKKQLEMDLGKLQFQDVDGSFTDYENFYKEEAFKYEKGLAPAISIGGSLGGLWVGAKVGGTVGTAIGGPIGTVVGGIVGGVLGIGVSLFSGWLGGKAKNYVQDERGKASMRDLELPIEAFSEKLRMTISEEINSFVHKINLSLQQFIDQQERELEYMREEHRKDVNLSEEEVAERRQQIEKDIVYLESLEVVV
ncbi:dynamin family protein [Niallia taxi]|uniref:dynamin family protein n=1 Tax=Niallia taxi TaxID=2499688 RepID=UPI003982CF35